MTRLFQLPSPCLIYHFTALENLPAILTSGGLVCKSRASPSVDISDGGIQGRRARRKVEAGPGGVLHDYVPFYFTPKSPMIHRIFKQDRADGTVVQKRLVYLVSSVENVAALSLPFAFTDGHAEMRVDVRYFDNKADLVHLDWRVIRAAGWNGDEQRRKRQSEFLIHGAAPLSVLLGFATQSEAAQNEVEQLLEQYGVTLWGGVRPGWYY
ncbi:DUF4433 domain-containing protein [Deinococcus frigens]|uniref:type II toxin-antitoxin system toxin DNA ADP-ribosyl transferase DarT n=1 Tax=Deinococcus frigens TaxID=249403 RepID=UPI00068F6461|nr:DUF4433 domain-containing protein [Deinococcus frigens]